MAARRANFDLSKFHTYSDVSKLGKVDVKRLASQLNCFPATSGKKALVNIVCNELNISTCGNNTTGKKRSCIENEIGGEETTWLSYLQKLRNWGKSISSLPENIDIQSYSAPTGLSLHFWFMINLGACIAILVLTLLLWL